MTDSLRDIITRYSQPLEPLDAGVKSHVGPLNHVRAVLFDVYGTLLVSGCGDIGSPVATDRGQALAATLAAENIPLSASPAEIAPRIEETILEMHTEMKADGADVPEVDFVDVWSKLLGDLHARGQVPVLPSLEIVRRLTLEYELRVNPVWPMPAAREVLLRLHEVGIVTGIISNAQFFTEEILVALFGQPLSQLGLAEDLLFYSYRFRRAKPSTYLYEQARDALGRRAIEAGQVLYVGNDMLNDITPAAKVGFRTALFAGDRRSYRPREGDQRVRGVAPDLVLTDLTQIFHALELSPPTTPDG